MCPPNYHHTGCEETRKIGHMVYSYTWHIVGIGEPVTAQIDTKAKSKK